MLCPQFPTRIPRAFLALLVAGLALLLPYAAAQAGSISITHVTVIDVMTGAELKDQTVVLRDGRIASVSPASVSPASSAPASDGQAIDAQGGFLIPGLWDMHVHIQDTDDLPLYIANGVTGVRLMFGAKDTPALRKELAAVPVSPQILVGSAIVDGNPPVWPGSIVVTNAKEARKVVDEIKAGAPSREDLWRAVAQQPLRAGR
jgi:hypothetical protein